MMNHMSVGPMGRQKICPSTLSLAHSSRGVLFGDRFIFKGEPQKDLEAWQKKVFSTRSNNFILYVKPDAFVLVSQDSLEKAPYDFYDNLIKFISFIETDRYFSGLPKGFLKRIKGFVDRFLSEYPDSPLDPNKNTMKTYVSEA
ncbi:MAG: hypothetical protein K2X66_14410 [Cyanobacteria bacterium]|nr:hypothetical protein [Cyanobacteriota bacterium]